MQMERFAGSEPGKAYRVADIAYRQEWAGKAYVQMT